MTLLLVASGGGHLAQLHQLAPRIPGYDDAATWVTFDTPQSRSLLDGARHEFLPAVAPRDARRAVGNIPAARRIIRETNPSLVISAGNAIAVSFLPAAAAMGFPTAYIESAARADGPSVTGRILRRIPGIQLYTQYNAWASPPWRYIGSVFDQFSPTSVPGQTVRLRQIVVTLGMIKFGFRRLIERLVQIIPADCAVCWQVGATDVSGLGIDAHTSMPDAALQQAMREADVVIAHAGTGSALAALKAGRCPVLVPREHRYGEHIDDHQHQIAYALSRQRVAIARRVEELTLADLVDATSRHAETIPTLSPLAISTR